jgi:hypothetical protein
MEALLNHPESDPLKTVPCARLPARVSTLGFVSFVRAFRRGKKKRRRTGGCRSNDAISTAGGLVAITRTTTRTTRTTGLGKAAARTAARFHRLGFVDGQVATVVVASMERLDGLLALFRVAHGDETESTGAIGFAIHDQVGFFDGAILSEKLVQVLFGGLEGKISYVQFHIFLYFEVTTSRTTIEEHTNVRIGYRWKRSGDLKTATWLQEEAM